jgi:hypothetical protein
MKYARVENGIVRELINFNPKGKFVKEIEEQFIECLEDTKQNDIYENGKFSKPTPKLPTQEEINEQTIQELNQTNNKLARLIEDLAEFCEGLGFVIPATQKELIAKRKEKRKKIK